MYVYKHVYILYAAVLSQVAVIGIIYGEDSSRTVSHNTQFFHILIFSLNYLIIII